MGQELKFKTNINCGGCVSTVQPILDAASGIQHWRVDTTSKDKVLTVVTSALTSKDIMAIVEGAGFKIVSLD